MGDLMDEGSVASTIQYNNYLKRFKHIYNIYPESVQVISLFSLFENITINIIFIYVINCV